MSISTRLKEERQRLGHSQTSFAEIAGVTKSAQIKWEKGTSAPTAPALSALAEAGADVLYILTGKRTADRPQTAAVRIGEQIDEIERNMLDPTSGRLDHESDEDAERNTMDGVANRLKALLKYDRQLMTPEMVERVAHLSEIAGDPAKLSILRSADFLQKRKHRERIRADFNDYLDGIPYKPSGEVLSALTMISLEYAVPTKVLANLVWDIVFEVTGQPKYSAGDDGKEDTVET